MPCRKASTTHETMKHYIKPSDIPHQEVLLCYASTILSRMTLTFHASDFVSGPTPLISVWITDLTKRSSFPSVVQDGIHEKAWVDTGLDQSVRRARVRGLDMTLTMFICRALKDVRGVWHSHYKPRPSTTSDATPSSSNAKKPSIYDFDSFTCGVEPLSTALMDQLERYLAAETFPCTDPLAYWNARREAGDCPELAQMALDYLSAPGE